MLPPIPAPNETSSRVTFSVDSNVASESGNLIVLVPVMLLISRVTFVLEPTASWKTGATIVLLDKIWVAVLVTNTLLSLPLFRSFVGGTSNVWLDDEFWLVTLKVIFLVLSVPSWRINDSTVLFWRIWVVSVPTNVRLKSGTVIILFAVKSSVLSCAQAVPISASVWNLISTKLLLRTVCSALVSSNVDDVAVGSAVVVTVPASGSK